MDHGPLQASRLSWRMVWLPLRHVFRSKTWRNGPPPLRGCDAKGIWGFKHLTGTDKIRVTKANALLRRMHATMRELERLGVPFYLENPLRSKLWCHPHLNK